MGGRHKRISEISLVQYQKRLASRRIYEAQLKAKQIEKEQEAMRMQEAAREQIKALEDEMALRDEQIKGLLGAARGHEVGLGRELQAQSRGGLTEVGFAQVGECGALRLSST